MAIVTSTRLTSQCSDQRKFKNDISKCAGILTGQRIRYSKTILVSLGLDNFFAAIVTARADVVTQMRLTSGGLNRQCRGGQKVVCTVHAAFGWGFLILLNSHDNS
jgi:hypothetical protein